MSHIARFGSDKWVLGRVTFVNVVWVVLASHEVVKEYIIGSKHRHDERDSFTRRRGGHVW